MVVHGGYKIMSDMEHILKYMKGTFPEVKLKLFDTIAEGKFERLVNWHKNTLKPRCDSLINLQFLSTSNDEDKQKDIVKFEKLLKNADDMLKEIKEENDNDDIDIYFSGTGEISAIDIILHSQICTIVDMYSENQKISERKYEELSAWMELMNNEPHIEDNLRQMKDVIKQNKLYGYQV